MTRESYIEELEHTPPSDCKFDFNLFNLHRKKIIFGLSFKDFVGYIINSATGVITNTPVYIGDILDRNTSVFVDNCTRLACKSRGIEKQKTPCECKNFNRKQIY